MKTVLAARWFKINQRSQTCQGRAFLQEKGREEGHARGKGKVKATTDRCKRKGKKLGRGCGGFPGNCFAQE